jgi:hypothetical protein
MEVITKLKENVVKRAPLGRPALKAGMLLILFTSALGTRICYSSKYILDFYFEVHKNKKIFFYMSTDGFYAILSSFL